MLHEIKGHELFGAYDLTLRRRMNLKLHGPQGS